MKTLLSRLSIVVTLLLLPGCATTLAQDPPQEYPTVVRYSAEELDNLVAPVALYPDALLAHVLVAATFPDDVDKASRYVRDRGSRGIDDQDWDVSVKSIAHYPPVLNMLHDQDDWAIALGQAYAAQPDDVMDAVQRLRVMARDQGNLVSTPEQTVSVRRQYIVIEPANPEVIYVPTYEPNYIYTYPVYRYGFHTNHFSFGIGFPIGPWLGYDVDWFAHRVYYQGWYAGGWRRYQPGWGVIPVYVYRGPRYVRPNVYVFVRPVNYINLDRRYRYVRTGVNFGRHDRGWNGRRDGDRDDDRRGRNAGNNDRDGSRGDDRRGSNDDGPRNGNGNGNDNGNGNGNGNGRGRPGGNDRDGARVATFDDVRPEKGGAAESRPEEPVMRSGFDKVEKPRVTPEPAGERRGDGPAVIRGSSGNVPSYVKPQKTVESRSRLNEPAVYRGSTRSNAPTFVKSPKSEAGNMNGTSVNRGPRGVEMRAPAGKSNSGYGSAASRSGARSSAPVMTAPAKQSTGKGGGNAAARTKSSGGGSNERGSTSRKSKN